MGKRLSISTNLGKQYINHKRELGEWDFLFLSQEIFQEML